MEKQIIKLLEAINKRIETADSNALSHLLPMAMQVLDQLSKIKSNRPITIALIKKEKQVKDMQIGESGYVVSWAIKQNATIDKGYNVYDKMGGTVDTLITKVPTGLLVKGPKAYGINIQEV